MGLAADTTRKVEDLLESWNPHEAKQLSEWMSKQYILKPARTPSDQKMNLWQLNALVISLSYANLSGVREHWPRTKDIIQEMAEKFSIEGKSDLVREVEVNGVLYKNLQNLPKASFMKMVNVVDTVFKSIHGWRRKGLAGQPTVAFAGADLFRGTSKARYNRESDTMFARATPAVVKRTGGEYASFEYILVHELGHRFEYLRKVHMDFGRPEWYTTPYSQAEGGFGHSESFAELFALGHFGITSHGSTQFGDVIGKFEVLMTSGHAEPSDEPEAVRVASRFLQADPARVASRFLESTFQAPRTISDKSEAENLVRGLTRAERDILRHLHHHGSVVTEMGSHATLGPAIGKRNPNPHDYQKIPNGLLVVHGLERSKWLWKTTLPTSTRAINWQLTPEAAKVLRLAAP